MDPVPLTPAIVAVIVTEPTLTPFIAAVLPGDTPRVSLLLTIARLVSLLAQNIFLAFSVSPRAPMSVAFSCTVFPTATLSGVGFTLTDTTVTNESTVVAAESLLQIGRASCRERVWTVV